MQLPEVQRAGHHQTHPVGFTIDRPQGSGDWLFLEILTPAWLMDGDGQQRVEPGSMILFPPGVHQWYGSLKPPEADHYADHWMHVVGIDDLVRHLQLPVNRLWRPRSTHPTGPLFQSLGRELQHRPPGHDLACASLAVHILTLAARSLASDEDPLLLVREQVHQHLDRRWTIQAMATLARLSTSRFSARWRQRFGCSPLDDLIAMRIERAGWLLAEGRPVGEVATITGFADPRYFSRVFHQRTGRAPSQARAGRMPDV